MLDLDGLAERPGRLAGRGAETRQGGSCVYHMTRGPINFPGSLSTTEVRIHLRIAKIEA